MRVLTFSRTYPGYHPRKGESTGFIEKILKSQCIEYHTLANEIQDLVSAYVMDSCFPKGHTIRAGHRWKEGDWFSPRVWSGKPYASKQIQFAPPIQIKTTWDFEIDAAGVFALAKPGEQLLYSFQPLESGSEDKDDQIAANDGLTFEDFYNWFTMSPDFKKNEGFTGQIICWNESIEY